MMKRMMLLIVVSTAAVLAACAAPAPQQADDAQDETVAVEEGVEEEEVVAVVYPNLGEAPELHDGPWLNTDQSYYLSDLRGQVVLLEMWTFGCYNCKNVMPSLKEWHSEYSDDGLFIIGNHYPEFNYEYDIDNLQQAIVDYELPYAVLQDNGRETWGAYGNRAWPTLYLIDKWGNIRYTHRGEGRYAETEAAIQSLLAEPYDEGMPPPYEIDG